MKNVHPTDVIQIISHNQKKNFPQKLTPDYWTKNQYSSSEILKYELHCLPSVAESSDALFDVTAW